MRDFIHFSTLTPPSFPSPTIETFLLNKPVPLPVLSTMQTASEIPVWTFSVLVYMKLKRRQLGLLRQGLSLAWNSPIRLGWLTREPQKSAWLCFPSTETDHSTCRRLLHGLWRSFSAPHACTTTALMTEIPPCPLYVSSVQCSCRHDWGLDVHQKQNGYGPSLIEWRQTLNKPSTRTLH